MIRSVRHCAHQYAMSGTSEPRVGIPLCVDLRAHLQSWVWRRIAETVDERLMGRHGCDAAGDDLTDSSYQLLQLALGDQVDRRMIAARHNSLPEHDLHPAGEREHLLGVAEEAAAVAEQADVVGELLRDLHAAAVLPERRVAPLG